MTSGTDRDLVGRFRTEKARSRFYAAYDRACDRLWTGPREVLDVDTRFGTTRVYRHGSAEVDATPIVLLSGALGNSLMWYPHVPALAERHTVYTVDTVGEPGRSVQRAPIRDGQDGAAWLRETLTGLDVRRAHLVGCSYGGWLALHHAIEAPARTVTLCLLDPALGPPGAKFFAWMFACGVAGLAPADIRRHAARILSNGALNETELLRVGRSAMAFVRRLPPAHALSDDRLRALRVPTLLLLGQRSTLHDPAAVRSRAQTLIPDVHCEIIPGTGHSLPMERPALTAARISEFALRHRPDDPG
ncbi:alpha/beta fold hydrolase [Actinoallomurus rhizosphaericola]|uniref:alpha/beta fold hydrolase n=1 Tax=Actinoallomurus rhizosphaericola TaxID=2952536 RepID=UPI0020902BB6|nr:alpha/beta hydrolase [Actinoallomurus rhizosphaericola]MCO5993715.1 alpha/beta hydrolase [Actinoallomurus rhizosphaericola]